MEEKKNNNGVHVSDTPNAEMTTESAVQNHEEMTINELDALKKELKSMTEERQKYSTFWIEALADIRRYQTAINKLVEELGWDQATAIGKIGEILGDSLWRVIEINDSSRFNR